MMPLDIQRCNHGRRFGEPCKKCQTVRVIRKVSLALITVLVAGLFVWLCR